MIHSKHIIVVGGGAAGMVAALTAAQAGGTVTLVERNARFGRKLYITGKGRCNLTNNCGAEEVLQNVLCNRKFLYSAMSAFPPVDVMAFFEELGVPLKTERGNRVFPVSDRAADVIDALGGAVRRAGVHVVTGHADTLLVRDGKVEGVLVEGRTMPAACVVVATGGVSYPLTGSTGDGYAMAVAAGHTIVPPRPSLVPLDAEGEDCAAMQGLALRNVALRVTGTGGKAVFAEQGELLFTHFGLSGPLTLSASAHMRNFERDHYTAWIDLKPALEEEVLDKRLLRDFSAFSNRDFGNYVTELVPRLMVPVLVRRSGIPPATKVHSISRTQRVALISAVKQFSIAIKGPRPMEEAIITSGGVKVSELEPKTMESKRTRGLYFAGEVMDVDAYTGGFNLQIAWATGRAAGLGAAKGEEAR